MDIPPDDQVEVLENTLSRRSFTRWLMGFSITATLAGVLTPVVGFLLPPSRQSATEEERTDVGTVAEFLANTGKVVAVASHPVIITNPQGAGLYAFSAICTHLGCIVRWNEAGYIQCPCHDGRFNAKTGAVISGPPPRPLPGYELSVDGNDVIVGRPVGPLFGEG